MIGNCIASSQSAAKNDYNLRTICICPPGISPKSTRQKALKIFTELLVCHRTKGEDRVKCSSDMTPKPLILHKIPLPADKKEYFGMTSEWRCIALGQTTKIIFLHQVKSTFTLFTFTALSQCDTSSCICTTIYHCPLSIKP